MVVVLSATRRLTLLYRLSKHLHISGMIVWRKDSSVSPCRVIKTVNLRCVCCSNQTHCQTYQPHDSCDQAYQSHNSCDQAYQSNDSYDQTYQLHDPSMIRRTNPTPNHHHVYCPYESPTARRTNAKSHTLPDVPTPSESTQYHTYQPSEAPASAPTHYQACQPVRFTLRQGYQPQVFPGCPCWPWPQVTTAPLVTPISGPTLTREVDGQ